MERLGRLNVFPYYPPRNSAVNTALRARGEQLLAGRPHALAPCPQLRRLAGLGRPLPQRRRVDGRERGHRCLTGTRELGHGAEPRAQRLMVPGVLDLSLGLQVDVPILGHPLKMRSLEVRINLFARGTFQVDGGARRQVVSHHVGNASGTALALTRARSIRNRTLSRLRRGPIWPRPPYLLPRDRI